MSCILPAQFREAARNLGYDVADDTRGFAFNAELTDLVKFLAVGKHPLIARVVASENEIKLMAYYIWEKENRPNGRDVEHWLKAEAIWERKHQNLTVAPI
jgi:hypothetical protein